MSGRAPLVLVVTSSPDSGEVLCGGLRRASYMAALAVDGRTALRAAAQQPPALVIADARLPDMEGEMMLRALRQLPDLSTVPAIAVNGHAGGERGGVFDHALPGPVNAGRLLELARTLVGGSEEDRPGHDRPHVLIVHHDDEQRRLAMVCLRHAGYEITSTAGAMEAIDLTSRRTPDAVVSEVSMPGMDGYELAFELRRREPTRQIPIILTCSPRASVDPEMVSAVGASALVAQTPDMGDLVDAIRSRLSPGAGSEPIAEPDAIRFQQLLRSNAELRERLAEQSVELAFLAGLGVGISCGGDPEAVLQEVLTRCAEMTGLHCGAAFLAVGDAPLLLQGQVGFGAAGSLKDFFGDPELLADAARTAGEAVLRLPSMRFDRERAGAALRQAGLAQMLIAPVRDAGRLLGVIVFGSTQSSATPHEELLLAAIAGQVGRWLSRVSWTPGLSGRQRRIVERLARAAEFRDEETASHTRRVSQYCGLLARLSGIDEPGCELIAAASAMHDIGKLGIPDSILLKPGPLTASERMHMQRHAEYGRRILAGESDPLLDLASTIAWTHHERWDGGGYPRGVSGAEIPLAGRIVAIGDVFDALTSDRVYRPAMSVTDAIRLMQADRGTHFDPELLDLFVGSLSQVLEIRRRHPDTAPERSSSVAVA